MKWYKKYTLFTERTYLPLSIIEEGSGNVAILGIEYEADV
jgi:hypothetical protein